MTELTDPPAITHDPNLKPGEVALVFGVDDVRIAHNVTSVAVSQRLTGGEDAAGFVMALACMMMLNSEASATGFMRLAGAQLDKLQFPGATDSLQ